MSFIRVLFVLSGKGISGAEYVLLDTLKYLSDIQCCFFINEKNEKLINEIKKSNISDKIYIGDLVIPYSRTSRFITAPIEMLLYRKKLANLSLLNRIKNDYDIIYLNNTIEVLSFPFEFFNARVIAHIHDMVDSIRPAARYLLKERLKKVDHIISVSDAVKNSLVKIGVEERKITTIYNYVMPEEPTYSNSIKIPKYISLRKIRIGFIGDMIKRKGPDILAKACLELEKKIEKEIIVDFIYKNYDMKIVKYIKDISIYGKNTNYCLLGAVNRQNLLERYKEYDLIVVPSRRDPLPTVILEALKKRIIVVASEVDGIPEIIPEKIFLFKKGDYKDLADKISRLVSYPYGYVLDKMRNVLDFYDNTFTKERKINKINHLFENCLRK